MPRAKRVETVGAAPEVLWDLLGDFGGVERIAGVQEVRYEGEPGSLGMQRLMQVAAGTIVEELAARDAEAMTLGYRVVSDDGLFAVH